VGLLFKEAVKKSGNRRRSREVHKGRSGEPKTKVPSLTVPKRGKITASMPNETRDITRRRTP
jgi:hypothetical protein